MVLVEVPGIACYLPSSLVQNVVQLSVTWEREKEKKVKPATHQFGKDHSPAFLSHSTAPHTHVRSAPILIHNKKMKQVVHGYCLGEGHTLQNWTKDDKRKWRRKRGYRHKMKIFRKKAASKRKNPIIRTCKARPMISISGAYYNFLAPMPNSMTTKQLLEEGSNTGTARVPRTSYFYASLLVGTPGYCSTKHWASIPTPATRRLDLEVLVSCWWLQTQFLRDSSIILETMISLML